jgi:hypothetical protein
MVCEEGLLLVREILLLSESNAPGFELKYLGLGRSSETRVLSQRCGVSGSEIVEGIFPGFGFEVLRVGPWSRCYRRES